MCKQYFDVLHASQVRNFRCIDRHTSFFEVTDPTSKGSKSDLECQKNQVTTGVYQSSGQCTQVLNAIWPKEVLFCRVICPKTYVTENLKYYGSKLWAFIPVELKAMDPLTPYFRHNFTFYLLTWYNCCVLFTINTIGTSKTVDFHLMKSPDPINLWIAHHKLSIIPNKNYDMKNLRKRF